ncbi:uncharacterized protein LOC127710428 [Mytilus californianus]|uniref:uncharacterized protein LOC127710428 n=1 Tax=Mytilus californianus TaxID=6549 RepID=UPI002245742B|nr:uncharacterized protein LOC127710428 [Mytilus californianus]
MTTTTDQQKIIPMNIKDKENTLELLGKETDQKVDIQKDFGGNEEKIEQRVSKIEIEQTDVIPRNIRDQIKKKMQDWEEKDKMFVPTRASDYVMKSVGDKSCVTLTAPSGVGKSFISRHTALALQKEGYDIIPVELPTEIKTYYQPGKKTVFIVDDICGNFTADQQRIYNWEQLLPTINTIIADKCCKIIVSCRLQVFKDNKFNTLSPFKSCECNLISDKLCLTSVEKTNIAKTYIGTSMTDIDDLSSKCDFFPLLCSLYHEKEDVDVKEYFKNPFDVHKSELDRLSEHGDEGKYKICSLALCVLFNNQLKEKWFQGKMTEEQGQIIKDTCEACEFNSIPKAKLKKALDTLDGTFICKQNGIYRTVHDKLFDFLAHYFGQKMIECLIDHGDSGLVRERFIWQNSSDDKNSNIDFIIEISHDYLESYLKRFIKDWSAGKVASVFSNNNMKVQSFRQQLLQYLHKLDKSEQVTLASTKDTVRPKEHHVSVQLLMKHKPNINAQTYDGGNALYFSALNGNLEITQLLLENNADCNTCINSKQSITDTLNNHQSKTLDEEKQLLFDSLIKNSSSHVTDDVSKKSVDYAFDVVAGSSPFHIACFTGRLDVVQCLLDHNANINMTKEDGTTPLFFACEVGHENIVCLLLDKGAKTEICRLDGKSPLNIAADNGHTSIVMIVTEHMRKEETLLNSCSLVNS